MYKENTFLKHVAWKLWRKTSVCLLWANAPFPYKVSNWRIAEAPEAKPTLKSREITLIMFDKENFLYRRHIVCRHYGGCIDRLWASHSPAAPLIIWKIHHKTHLLTQQQRSNDGENGGWRHLRHYSFTNWLYLIRQLMPAKESSKGLSMGIRVSWFNTRGFFKLKCSTLRGEFVSKATFYCTLSVFKLWCVHWYMWNSCINHLNDCYSRICFIFKSSVVLCFGKQSFRLNRVYVMFIYMF